MRIPELEYDNPSNANSLTGEIIEYSKCARLISDIHAQMPLINESRMSAREELYTLEVSSNFCINQSTLTIFLEQHEEIYLGSGLHTQRSCMLVMNMNRTFFPCYLLC